MRPRSRSGFTLIELTIVVALLSVVMVKLTIVIDQAQRSHQNELQVMALENRARQVLDRVAYAVTGAERAGLDPGNIMPLDQSELAYRISLGVENGQTVWVREKIGLQRDDTSMYWVQNEAEPDERRVTWCNAISQLLEDELLNGADDNDNDIADEKGLSFTLKDDMIVIRLTLQREAEGEDPIQVSVRTAVTCRN